MDQDIYTLVAKYGFKNLHTRLLEIMRDEYTYLQTQFQILPIKEIAPVTPPAQKKLRKPRLKSPIAVSELKTADEVQISLENVETKDIIVSVPENKYRDPKEMKEYQRSAVESKRKENEIAGLEPSYFLTKENLKQWIEVEGRTYAWVAREKAGCPETQVAAQAQMMGIKSRISKTKGRIMTGN
jgi:hypothetical protein